MMLLVVYVKQKKFVKNAIAACSVTILMSIVGMIFRTYISNRIGSEGMGLLQLVMSVYLPACTLASSGVYVASTRLCAAAVARKDRRVSDMVTSCLLYGSAFGAAAFLLLFFGAGFISDRWLSYPQAETPLKILAFALPFLSISNALQGFFLALRSAAYATVLQVTEDVTKIAATVILFAIFAGHGPTIALCAMVAGMALGEIVSCLCGYVLYLRKRTRLPAGEYRTEGNLLREVIRIALPCAVGGYLRSGMGMLESILIPHGLTASGLTEEQTLATLGKLEGMALPILLFPASFLGVISKLLVPEIAAERAVGNDIKNKKTTEDILRTTAMFAIFVGCFSLLFGKRLGMAIYHDTACGTYLTILSPLVPILYADKVIDGMMKGYDKQITTLKINLIDSAFRTVAALLILPRMGINGYIAILYVGSTLNFLLSYFALRRTCGLRFPVREGILKGGLAALASMLPLKIAEKLSGITIGVALGASIPLFLMFLYGLSATGSHGKHQKLIGKHTSG